MDIVDPFAKCVRVPQNLVSKRLEFNVIVERSAAILTRKHILQKFEPFFDRGSVLEWIRRNQME
jgi:hypothetical protein